MGRNRRACLADFGLSTIVSVDTHLEPTLMVAKQRDSLMSFIYGGSYPWMSPELLDQDDTSEHGPTKESDIYALGMLIYEVRTRGRRQPSLTIAKDSNREKQVLCGKAPFDDLPNPAMIVVEITRGTRPKKPEDAARFGFTDGLWAILERCWSADKEARPELGTILSCLSDAGLSSEDRWQLI